MGLEDLFGSLAKEALNLVRQKTGVDLSGIAGSQSPAPAGAAAAPVTDAPRPSGSVPFGLDARPMPSGESVDVVFPARVGEFGRARINDRFGGIRSGGVFAGYRSGDVEVRMLVTLHRNAAAARERVREGRGEDGSGEGATSKESLGTESSYSLNPGSAVWNRGPYCFSASSNDTEGDEPLPATAEQIAALERFMAAFPY
jgi:hypothetical protein